MVPDYAKAQLEGIPKGKAGISHEKLEGGQPSVVYRNAKGKAIGVLRHNGEALTDIAVSDKQRGKGIGSKMVDAAKAIGVTKAKGPFTVDSRKLLTEKGLIGGQTKSIASDTKLKRYTEGETVRVNGSSDGKFSGFTDARIVDPHSNAQDVDWSRDDNKPAKGRLYDKHGRSHIPTATVEYDRSKRGLPPLRFEAYHHQIEKVTKK